MDKAIKQTIETIIEELNYALLTANDDNRDFYIRNAIRFAEEIINSDPIPLPTIKPGDKVRHKSIGTTGKVAETSDIGAFVHWSTGQRSWYPFEYLEVASDE